MRSHTTQALTLTTLLAMFITGCGEESNKAVFGDSAADAVIVMGVGDSTQVLKGDILEPNNGSTQIQVNHTLDNDTKIVTILSGSATLLRGSYAVE